MDRINDILEQLENRKACFYEYESLTRTMLSQEWESLGQGLEQRQIMMKRIDEINRLLEGLIKESVRERELYRKIMRNQVDKSQVGSEYWPLIETVQAIHEAIGRIVKLESLIESRLLEARDEAAEGIKAGHQTPKILKYREALESKEIEGSLLKGSNRKA